ncbi:MAG: hypothetical protein JRJ26_12625 [Deltaproteobacteria bacterium]|nr:hypothetical protein [Deltaproteobacteria bacterium]
MAKAKRYYIPGQVWHLTGRCHQRGLLLKFAKDLRGWLDRLFNGRKAYGLSISNYGVTSSHVHKEGGS